MFQDHIVSVLLKSGKREPAGLARCIALSSLGIYLYEEFSHGTFHPKIKETINVLLMALKVCGSFELKLLVLFPLLAVFVCVFH